MSKGLRELLLTWAEARMAVLNHGRDDKFGQQAYKWSRLASEEEAAREAFLNFQEPQPTQGSQA